MIRRREAQGFVRHRFFPFLICVIVLAACAPEAQRSSQPTEEELALITKALALPEGDSRTGEKIYRVQCITCHNVDPNKPGPVGPQIAGTDRRVLAYKVISGKYPEGYEPRRETAIMTPLPKLAGTVHHLAAYLKGAALASRR